MEDVFYLNDAEKAQVEKFLDNKVMAQAVRKVLLHNIYNQGVLEEGKEADEGNNIFMAQLTQQTIETAPAEIYALHAKSLVNGIRMLMTGFEELKKCRKVEPAKVNKENRGR